MKKKYLLLSILTLLPTLSSAALTASSPTNGSVINNPNTTLSGNCDGTQPVSISSSIGTTNTGCSSNKWTFSLSGIYSKLKDGPLPVTVKQGSQTASVSYTKNSAAPVPTPVPTPTPAPTNPAPVPAPTNPAPTPANPAPALTFSKTYLEKADLSAMKVLRPATLADAIAQMKSAAPNTRIILPVGTFTDQTLALYAPNGTEAGPVVVEGNEKGTLFSGKFNMTVKGNNLLLNKINLKNYDSKTYGGGGFNFGFDGCFKCGLYNSDIRDSVPAIMSGDTDTKHFKTVLIKPTSQNVEIANNVFTNKQNQGSVVLVYRDTKRTTIHEGHRIYKNKFLARKLEVNDANDFDVIRIGDSTSSQFPSPANATASLNQGIIVGNIVENNLFEDVRIKDPNYDSCVKGNTWTQSICKGEPEIISVKAPQTIVRFNTFRNSSGGVTIRHGFQSIIEGNYFFGPMTSSYGVRVIGDSHLVMNNHFENLSAASKLLGGISILPGQPNAAPSGYWPVFDTIIAMNYVKNTSKRPISLASDYGGREKTILPTKVVFSYNAIKGKENAFANQGPSESFLPTFSYQQNLFDGPELGIQTPLATYQAITDDNSLSTLLRSTDAKKTELINSLRQISSDQSAQKMQKLMGFLLLKNQSLKDAQAPQ